MANPPGTHHQESAALNGARHPASGNNGCAGPESSEAVLKHNPGISCEWSAEEQAILEDGLAKYAADSSISRYSKIAFLLPKKTVRDVALRSRWMSQKENSKKRKEESRKHKDKKVQVTDSPCKSFPFASQLNASSSYANTANYEDGTSYQVFGELIGQLLEQNARALGQISYNFSIMKIQDNLFTKKEKIQDNLDLLRQTRDNIVHVMNCWNDGSEIMRQMPPLLERLNEELANTIIPLSNWIDSTFLRSSIH